MSLIKVMKYILFLSIYFSSCSLLPSNTSKEYVIRGHFWADKETPIAEYYLGWKEGLLAAGGQFETIFTTYRHGKHSLSVIYGDPFEEALTDFINNREGKFEIEVSSIRSRSITLFFLHNDNIVCYEISDICKQAEQEEPLYVWEKDGCVNNDKPTISITDAGGYIFYITNDNIRPIMLVATSCKMHSDTINNANTKHLHKRVVLNSLSSIPIDISSHASENIYIYYHWFSNEETYPGMIQTLQLVINKTKIGYEYTIHDAGPLFFVGPI